MNGAAGRCPRWPASREGHGKPTPIRHRRHRGCEQARPAAPASAADRLLQTCCRSPRPEPTQGWAIQACCGCHEGFGTPRPGRCRAGRGSGRWRWSLGRSPAVRMPPRRRAGGHVRPRLARGHEAPRGWSVPERWVKRASWSCIGWLLAVRMARAARTRDPCRVNESRPARRTTRDPPPRRTTAAQGVGAVLVRDATQSIVGPGC